MVRKSLAGYPVPAPGGGVRYPYARYAVDTARPLVPPRKAGAGGAAAAWPSAVLDTKTGVYRGLGAALRVSGLLECSSQAVVAY